MTPAESSRALASLPHGPEFRFIDALTELVPGVSGVGSYLVRGDEVFLKGHFPKVPIFPGVLLVEGGAQLAGTVAQSDPATPSLSDVKLTAMKNIKVYGTALPGETIIFRAEVLGRMGNLIQSKVSATVNDITVMQGEITLSGSVPSQTKTV